MPPYNRFQASSQRHTKLQHTWGWIADIVVVKCSQCRRRYTRETAASMKTDRHAQRVLENCPDLGFITFGSVVVGVEKERGAPVYAESILSFYRDIRRHSPTDRHYTSEPCHCRVFISHNG